MRAKGHEQLGRSQAWEIAEGFLATHAVSPDGQPVSPNIVQVLMVGVWAGCRFAMLDRDLALGIARSGNERRGLVFEALRLAFAEEFHLPLQQVLIDALRNRGFTNALAVMPDVEPQPRPLTGADAVDAAEEFLRGEPAADEEESS
jgi:hypothetical protein